MFKKKQKEQKCDRKKISFQYPQKKYNKKNYFKRKEKQ